MKHATTCIFAASILAACGGGGDASGGAEDVASCAPVTVQLFGDSTQAAAGPHLQAALDARLGAGVARVEQRAVSGTNSQQLLTGADGMNKPWPQSVAAQIVVVNHGINDSGRGVTPEAYATALRAFAGAPAAVLLQTPNPVEGWGFDTVQQAAAMRAVSVDAGAALADVQAYVLALPAWRSHVPDGAHPDDELQAMIARDVTAPAVASLVAAARCK